MEGSKRGRFVAREIDLFDRYGARRGRLDRIQPSGSLPLQAGRVGAPHAGGSVNRMSGCRYRGAGRCRSFERVSKLDLCRTTDQPVSLVCYGLPSNNPIERRFVQIYVAAPGSADPRQKIRFQKHLKGIHKRNCNSSRTVWENAGKTDETLGERTPLIPLGTGVSRLFVFSTELSTSFDPPRGKMRLRI
jgi:hypothetical protein